MTESEDLQTSKAYLTSLLNRNLRVHTTDSRMFLGQFKCTDSDQNIVLAHAFEYRIPPPPKIDPSTGSTGAVAIGREKESCTKKVMRDMESRYLGLIVVPGEHVVKVEVEEFVSQMKGGEGRK